MDTSETYRQNKKVVQKPLLAWVTCPNRVCQTVIPLYELPGLGEEWEIECPKCHDFVMGVEIVISNS